MKIMVFAPHPDDEILGCGGAMTGHIENGDQVTVVYMTSGDAGGYNISKEKLGSIREQEAKGSCSILGITDLVFLRNPDGYLEYNQDNMVALINLIRDRKPEWIYIPHQHDGHKDHRVTHELVVEAKGRAGGPWFQECQGDPWQVAMLLAYEVWTPLQQYSLVVDITPCLDRKLAALNLHQSQLANFRYDQAISGLNRYRGIMTGKGNYCECFQIL